MNKKKKIIIITSIIIILIIAFLIGYSYLVNKNKTYSSVDDFNDIKELVNYYNCEYKRYSYNFISIFVFSFNFFVFYLTQRSLFKILSYITI